MTNTTEKPVLTKEEKRDLRAKNHADRVARDIAEAEAFLRQQQEQFAKDTANWNDRLLNVVLEFVALGSNYQISSNSIAVTFTVYHDVERPHRTNYVVPRVPHNNDDDLYEMSQVEYEVQDYKDQLAEQLRIMEVRKIAKSKLTPEELKVLDLA